MIWRFIILITATFLIFYAMARIYPPQQKGIVYNIAPKITTGLPAKNTPSLHKIPTDITLTKISYPSKFPKQIIITPIINKNSSEEWGVARQIDDHTYTIKVGYDDKMGTVDEILDALNKYRNVYGKQTLNLDDNLSNYSQTRAQLFDQLKTTDKHQGFNDFLNNGDGFIKLGYQHLGENSYYGGSLYGVHLIEWVFAKSPEHNQNQLYDEWTNVGIGSTQNSVNIIFAAKKIN